MSEPSSDPEVVSAWFDKYEDEYLEFNRILPEARLHPAPKLCAMLCLSERSCRIDDWQMQGEHDIVYLQGLDRMGAGITEDDVIYLRRCGVHWEDDSECFAMFT